MTQRPLLDFQTVDSLEIVSVVDGSYNAVLAGHELAFMSVKRTSRPRPPSLMAEHGLAYRLLSTRGGERRQILLDFGLTGPTLMHNLRQLEIEPGDADALILSHGHGDHYGGLLEVADSTPNWAERRISLYAGGEDTFCRRWVVAPDGRPVSNEQLERAAIEERGIAIRLAPAPTVVANHAIVSGQIPRQTDFEVSPPSARLELGGPGSACGDAASLTPSAASVQPGDLVADLFLGEMATIYAIRGRGLVIISSCGHAGIINTIYHAQRITGIQRVVAVVGGWHLAAARDAVITSTVAALVSINAQFFVPMHCTGFATMARLERELPAALSSPR